MTESDLKILDEVVKDLSSLSDQDLNTIVFEGQTGFYQIFDYMEKVLYEEE